MIFLCFTWQSAISEQVRVLFLSLLNQILNSTTSDPRQDGQSSTFTTSSSQFVHGMRNCRVSVVAETEKTSLMEHRSLYPLLFAF